MRIAPIAAALVLAAAPLCSTMAAEGVLVESRPGAVSVGQSTQLTGTIARIDADSREVTVVGTDGRETVIACGPEVKNFDRLHVGDVVEMETTQALALELRKGSSAEVSRTIERATASASPDETPGGTAGVRMRVIAEVMAVDADTQTVTLRGPERTMDLAVKDPKQFQNIAVGDRIEATYVEAMAVQVTPVGAAE